MHSQSISVIGGGGGVMPRRKWNGHASLDDRILPSQPRTFCRWTRTAPGADASQRCQPLSDGWRQQPLRERGNDELLSSVSVPHILYRGNFVRRASETWPRRRSACRGDACLSDKSEPIVTIGRLSPAAARCASIRGRIVCASVLYRVWLRPDG